MTGPQWFIAAIIALQVLMTVTMPTRVGKPREPMTAHQAAIATALGLLVIAGYVWTWAAL